MRGRFLLPVSLVLVLSMSLPGSATHLYGNDDKSWHEHLYIGPAPVLLEAGHAEPANGVVVLTVRDDLWWWLSGQLPHLQQREMDGILCQVEPGTDPCEASPLAIDETYRSFCHGITLTDGENWDSNLDTYVWVGPNPSALLMPGITCERARPPTIGHVSHWPAHE